MPIRALTRRGAEHLNWRARRHGTRPKSFLPRSVGRQVPSGRRTWSKTSQAHVFQRGSQHSCVLMEQGRSDLDQQDSHAIRQPALIAVPSSGAASGMTTTLAAVKGRPPEKSSVAAHSPFVLPLPRSVVPNNSQGRRQSHGAPVVLADPHARIPGVSLLQCCLAAQPRRRRASSNLVATSTPDQV